MVLLVGCDPEAAAVDGADAGGGKVDDPTALADPDHGFVNYTTLRPPWDIGFCPDIRLATDPEYGSVHTVVNRTNAHYLAYISGNAYADFVHFAPLMEEMGFGTPGEGTRLAACGADLVRMRIWEARRQTCGARGCRPSAAFDPFVDEGVLELWGECGAE
jgi:hypothetical protein